MIRKKLKERCVRYAVHKILLLITVLAGELSDMVILASWFSVTGFFRFFALLTRDRFDYVRVQFFYVLLTSA